MVAELLSALLTPLLTILALVAAFWLGGELAERRRYKPPNREGGAKARAASAGPITLAAQPRWWSRFRLFTK